MVSVTLRDICYGHHCCCRHCRRCRHGRSRRRCRCRCRCCPVWPWLAAHAVRSCVVTVVGVGVVTVGVACSHDGGKPTPLVACIVVEVVRLSTINARSTTVRRRQAQWHQTRVMCLACWLPKLDMVFSATYTAAYLVPINLCHTLSLFVSMHTLLMYRHFTCRWSADVIFGFGVGAEPVL